MENENQDKNGYGERLEGESTLAYEYFCAYCALGVGRSLVRLSKVDAVDGRTRSPSALGDWCQKFNWVERVRQYDMMMLKKQFKERMEIERARFRGRSLGGLGGGLAGADAEKNADAGKHPPGVG